MFDLDGYIRFWDTNGLDPQPQKKLPVVYKWLLVYEGLRLSKQTTNSNSQAPNMCCMFIFLGQCLQTTHKLHYSSDTIDTGYNSETQLHLWINKISCFGSNHCTMTTLEIDTHSYSGLKWMYSEVRRKIVYWKFLSSSIVQTSRWLQIFSNTDSLTSIS